MGFNAGSVGVAVLGDYNSTRISAAARRSLEQLLSWKLDLAHVDPLSTLNWRSTGNPRFPRGVPVFLRAISGHRDTYFTDCPGTALYAELPRIAQDVSRIGLPKLYAPEATGKLGGPVTFSGRLSGAVPWTVTVTELGRRPGGAGLGDGAEPELDVGLRRRAAGPVHVDDRRARLAARRLRDARREGRRARVPEGGRVAGADRARRRSERRHGDDLVHADAGGDGDRDARRRERSDAGDAVRRLPAGRCAVVRLHAAARAPDRRVHAAAHGDREQRPDRHRVGAGRGRSDARRLLRVADARVAREAAAPSSPASRSPPARFRRDSRCSAAAPSSRRRP